MPCSLSPGWRRISGQWNDRPARPWPTTTVGIICWLLPRVRSRPVPDRPGRQHDNRSRSRTRPLAGRYRRAVWCGRHRFDRARSIPDNERSPIARPGWNPTSGFIPQSEMVLGRAREGRSDDGPYRERGWNGRSGPSGTADHRADPGPPERRLAGARPSGDVAVVHAGVSPGGAPCARGDDRGHGRQPVPRLHGGDRRDQRRALASQGRGGDPQAGGPADPHVGDRLLLHAAGPAGRAAGGDGPGPRAQARLLHQQRGRGDRGRAEAGAAAHGAATAPWRS